MRIEAFYDEERFGRRVDPGDRPVVAWFDLALGDKFSALSGTIPTSSGLAVALRLPY